MNFLEGIINIYRSKRNIDVDNISYRGNKINMQGDALEEFVKMGMAGVVRDDDYISEKTKIENAFIYGGNSNNPPDLITTSYEAIEVKKKKTYGGSLALNSSFPKDIMYSSDTKISKELYNILTDNNIENMDMIYSIGVIESNTLESLLFIYGSLFCAEEYTYSSLLTKIKEGISEIDGIEFTETNELGKVKKIDILNYTDLRIRGMWNIKNPLGNSDVKGVNICKSEVPKLVAIFPKNKYDSLCVGEIKTFIENKNDILVQVVDMQNPNNSANYIESVRLEFEL